MCYMACCSADEQLLTGDVPVSAEKLIDTNLLKYPDLLDGSQDSVRQRFPTIYQNQLRILHVKAAAFFWVSVID